MELTCSQRTKNAQGTWLLWNRLASRSPCRLSNHSNENGSQIKIWFISPMGERQSSPCSSWKLGKDANRKRSLLSNCKRQDTQSPTCNCCANKHDIAWHRHLWSLHHSWNWRTCICSTPSKAIHRRWWIRTNLEIKEDALWSQSLPTPLLLVPFLIPHITWILSVAIRSMSLLSNRTFWWTHLLLHTCGWLRNCFFESTNDRESLHHTADEIHHIRNRQFGNFLGHPYNQGEWTYLPQPTWTH